MSDYEKQQIVPSVIDKQIIQSNPIDQQTDKSDLTDPETVEADPAVQQIIESDIIDNNSSNDSDNSGSESPPLQPQEQYGPIIQDVGSEDEAHGEQGSGQEYQVQEPGNGLGFVPQPSHNLQPQVVRQEGRTGNIVIHNIYYQRTLQVRTRNEVNNAIIGAIGGGIAQPQVTGGLGEQAALAWLNEGASARRQVSALGGPGQRPDLHWHDEGGSNRGNQNPVG
ncbi:uncharacterized protein LOC120334466 [Styela clava]